MFCPKCGNQVSDDAAFCGKCGNKFDSATSAAVAASNAGAQGATASTGAGAPAGSTSTGVHRATKIPAGGAQAVKPAMGSGLKLAPIGIAAVILMIVAMIFTIFPWFELSSSLRTASSYASGIISGASSLFGGSSSAGASFDFDDSYTIWGLTGLADVFKNYANMASSLGSSNGAFESIIITIFSWICLILWLVSLVLTIWGAINAFMKGNLGVLRAGSILTIITVIVFFIFTFLMGSSSGNPTAMPVLCLLLAIVALVLSAAGKKKAVA